MEEKKILIVEDSPGDARFIEESLYEGAQKSQSAYHVSTTWVKSLADAKEKIQKSKSFHIILLDLGLPDSDGLEGVKQLKSLVKNTPIVVLTSRSDESLAIESLAFGAQDYLVKGTFDPYQLVTRSVSYALARQKVTSELEGAKKRLEVINQDLEQFVYVVSHDLQEPLRMVRSFLQMLEKRYSESLQEEALEFVHFAVDGASRMQGMLESLLEYSRVETRGQDFSLVPVRRILERVLKILSKEIERNQVTIKDDVEDIEIYCDEQQIGRVFKALIENAIKFKKEKGECIIHLKSRSENGQYVFSIEDNGIGIHENNLGRIFGIFQKLHSAEAYPGTGIGLSVSKRISQRHGGDCTVVSEFGKGSVFSFSLKKRTLSDE